MINLLNWFETKAAAKRSARAGAGLAVPVAQAERARPALDHAAANRAYAGYTLSFAAGPQEIVEAQRLRYKVFAEEMGAKLDTPVAEHDADEFDPYCEHLLVRDARSTRVVGTYRLLPPEHARRIGRLYADREFDLSRLVHLRERMVEAGRSCVHWEHRNGTVIMLLWSGIARYMQRYGYAYLGGCASISLRDGGHSAAKLYLGLRETQLAAPECRVVPKLPLPVERLAAAGMTGQTAAAAAAANEIRADTSAAASAAIAAMPAAGAVMDMPPLIKGYLRVGAKVAGAPAWDPDFNSADLFMLLPMQQLSPRYARRFT